MSIQITLRSNIRDLTLLEKALFRMGVTEQSMTRDTIVAQQKCALAIDQQVGFSRQADETLSLVGDPYYTQALRKYYRKTESLRQDLTANYLLEDAIVKARRAGFTAKEETIARHNDGTVTLEAWAR